MSERERKIKARPRCTALNNKKKRGAHGHIPMSTAPSDAAAVSTVSRDSMPPKTPFLQSAAPSPGVGAPALPAFVADAWFMSVGILTTLAVTMPPADRYGGSLQSGAPHGDAVYLSACGASHRGSVSVPRVNGRSKRDLPAPSFRRRITSSTFLRFMNVTDDMARRLGLEPASLAPACVHEACQTAAGGRTLLTLAGQRKSPTTSRACRTLTQHRPNFRIQLRLRDGSGRLWPMSYETTTSHNQYHRRLVHGWREFCRHHDLRVGDAVDFSRSPRGGQMDVDVKIVRRR